MKILLTRRGKSLIWVGVALAAVGGLFYRTPRTALWQTLDHLDWDWFLLGIFVYFVSQGLLAFRWQVLLSAQGIQISPYRTIMLTYLGLFYNNVMPGAVGGDFLKAWFVTKYCEAGMRVSGAITVFVDRLVGLAGIIALGAAASLFIDSEIAYRGVQVRWLVWAIAVVLCSVLGVLIRGAMGRFAILNSILQKLPCAATLRQINCAVRAYRTCLTKVLLATLLNIIVQGPAIVAIWMLTRALHLHEISFVECAAVIPVVWVIGAAIPVPAGLGVVEGLITYLFCVVINPRDPTSAIGQAVALALLNRFMVVVCSVPGALVPVLGVHLPGSKSRANVADCHADGVPLGEHSSECTTLH